MPEQSYSKPQPEEINLQNYAIVLKRRWLPASFVLIASVSLATLFALMQKPAYQATGRMIFQSDRSTTLTGGAGEKIGSLESLKTLGTPIDTQVVVVQSLPIIEETITKLDLKDKKGVPLDPEVLAKQIKVEAMSGTDILQVAYKSENPVLAAQIVNQVMSSYIKSNIQSNRAKITSAGRFVGQQLPRTEAEVNQAADALRRFQNRNRIVDLEKESAAVVASISNLNDQANNARAQLTDVSGQSGELRRKLGMSTENAVNSTSLSQIPGIQSVLTELHKVQTDLAAQSAVYTEAAPIIVKLKSQKATLETLLRQRISESSGNQAPVSPRSLQIGTLKESLTSTLVQADSQRLGLQNRVAELDNLREAYRRRAEAIPNLVQQQGILERRLLVAKTTYQNLLAKLQEIQIAENQTVGNAQIVQAAVVPKQAAASLQLLFIAGGGFVGLLLAIAVAFFIDLIDRSVKTVKEAEALFGYTLLGIIPKLEADSRHREQALERLATRVTVMDSPQSPINAAYQMLQANLKFISSDKKNRTIVITSSLPQEGKSDVAANLAAAIAQVGRRVLLVDADMRYPSQHHLWNLVNTVGLSNLLVEQEEIAHPPVHQITNNLSVLTAGVIPPNPLALIDSERMAALISLFSQEYDYVIFDTPTLAGRADAAVLGKMVDGVLLVVQPGIVDSASAAAAKALLSRSEPNILGMVANGVNVKQEPDSYFYYTNPKLENDIKPIIDPVSISTTAAVKTKKS